MYLVCSVWFFTQRSCEASALKLGLVVVYSGQLWGPVPSCSTHWLHISLDSCWPPHLGEKSNEAEQDSGMGHVHENVIDNDPFPCMSVAALCVSKFPLHLQWSTGGSTAATSTWVYTSKAPFSLVRGARALSIWRHKDKDSFRRLCERFLYERSLCLVRTTSPATKVVVKKKNVLWLSSSFTACVTFTSCTCHSCSSSCCHVLFQLTPLLSLGSLYLFIHSKNPLFQGGISLSSAAWVG